MIRYDENGIGECPKCKCFINYNEIFCTSCGIRLPCNSKKQKRVREKASTREHPSIHKNEKGYKMTTGDNYCPFCGKKL